MVVGKKATKGKGRVSYFSELQSTDIPNTQNIDEDTYVQKMGFPMGLIQTMKEELGGMGQPLVLNYNVPLENFIASWPFSFFSFINNICCKIAARCALW